MSDTTQEDIRKDDPVYRAAEQRLASLLSDDRYKVGTHTAANEPDAKAESLASRVVISGDPRYHSFADRVRNKEGLSITLIPDADLRAANEGQVRDNVFGAVQQALKDIKTPNGGSLADAYDWSAAAAKNADEELKSGKEQRADLLKNIASGLDQAPNAVPAEVAALLRDSRLLGESNGIFMSGGLPKPHESGTLELTFYPPQIGEGEKSNAAVARDNILARKVDILANIAASAIELHQKSDASAEDMAKYQADLAKLDLRAEVDGGKLTLTIGNKPAVAVDANGKEAPLEKTVLSEVAQKNIDSIVSDALLFKGKDAAAVAPLLASDTDVHRILETYKDKVPAFAEALKTTEMKWLDSPEEAKAREKEDTSAKLTPKFNIDTGFANGVRNNSATLSIQLPEGMTHSQVIKALAGEAMQSKETAAVGDATAAELARRNAAVANDDVAKRSA